VSPPEGFAEVEIFAKREFFWLVDAHPDNLSLGPTAVVTKCNQVDRCRFPKQKEEAQCTVASFHNFPTPGFVVFEGGRILKLQISGSVDFLFLG
jgi:hypothetical protein